MHSTDFFPPLSQINREVITTHEAAHYLNRRPNTLRCWAYRENGPIRPVKVGRYLGWRTSDIKKLLGMGV